MLSHYVTVWRKGFARRPWLSALNLICLAVSLAGAMYLFLFVDHSTRFDAQHPDAERIFRIPIQVQEPNGQFLWSTSSVPLAGALQSAYPDVETATRVFQPDRSLLMYQNKGFYEERVFFADSTFFEVFGFPLLKGAKKSALSGPNRVVLSKELAEKLFGTEDPMGKIVRYDRERDLLVTGIMDKNAFPSHLSPDGIISESGISKSAEGQWVAFSPYTYIKMRAGSGKSQLEAHLREIETQYANPQLEQYGLSIRYFVQPVREIHLTTRYQREPSPSVDGQQIPVFSLAAGLLLVIASINFLLLSLAQSLRRAREVAVRKTSGALPGEIARQFVAESMATGALALLSGVVLLAVLLPALNLAFDTAFRFSDVASRPVFWLGMLGGLALFTLAGSVYPAVVLGGLKPAPVLKGVRAKSGGFRLRQALVTVQLAVSFFLLVTTLVGVAQMRYLRQADLGFNPAATVVIDLSEETLRERWDAFRQQLLQSPAIRSAATAGASPGKNLSEKAIFPIETEDRQLQPLAVYYYPVDFDFFPAMDIPVVKGRAYAPEMLSDTFNGVMVNEALVQAMGWQEPIGKRIALDGVGEVFGKVIGVTRNFNQQALYSPIDPLLFFAGPANRYAHIRLNQVKEGLNQTEAAWRAVYPGEPFVYQFLDENFARQYHEDEIRQRMFTIFSLLTLLVALMGLLALTTFTLQHRKKEMAVRKVVGASTANLGWLLSRDYLLMTLLAAAVASPIAVWQLTQWLERFAYRTPLTWVPFTAALAGVLAVVLGVSAYHTWAAASTPPVAALRED